MTSTPTIAELDKAWRASCAKWNASGSTDHVKVIQLGEEIYFAALNLIETLKDEVSDLTDELESVRSSFKERWSSVMPQPRVIVVTGSDDERADLLNMLGISDRSEELTVTEVFERLTRLKGGE
jgi:hypothetical protein